MNDMPENWCSLGICHRHTWHTHDMAYLFTHLMDLDDSKAHLIAIMYLRTDCNHSAASAVPPGTISLRSWRNLHLYTPPPYGVLSSIYVHAWISWCERVIGHAVLIFVRLQNTCSAPMCHAHTHHANISTWAQNGIWRIWPYLEISEAIWCLGAQQMQQNGCNQSEDTLWLWDGLLNHPNPSNK